MENERNYFNKGTETAEKKHEVVKDKKHKKEKLPEKYIEINDEPYTNKRAYIKVVGYVQEQG